MQKITLAKIIEALENDRFSFYYQPQISLLTGKLIGVEALIRWIEIDGSLIYPDKFIPIAEKEGFISKITHHMLHKLVLDISLIENLNSSLKFSINFSISDINDCSIIETLKKYIKIKQIKNSSLCIEITEESCVNLVNSDNLEEISLLNIELIMDDYGIGYSNLGSLSNTNFKKVKIDRSLIKDIHKNKKNELIVSETIKLCHYLGLEVVAEGVECYDEYNLLQKQGCSYVQGYLISKPIPISQLINDFILNKSEYPSSPLGLLRLSNYSHLQWRDNIINKAFSNYISNNSIDIYLDVKDHKICSFGKWYYTDGIKNFHTNNHFKKIEEKHKELHILGFNLLEISQNTNSSIDDIISSAKKLSSTTIALSRLLTQLEFDVIKDTYKFDL